MKEYEGKVSLVKMASENNLLISNSKKRIIEDELIIYINELSSLIRKFNKSNIQNFLDIKNTFNKPIQNQKIITPIKLENILNLFTKIENSNSNFYSNAKDIFHKMKECHNKIKNHLKQNEGINKIMVTNNNINISNSIIHNKKYKMFKENIEDNLKLKFDTIQNENEEFENNHILSSRDTFKNYLTIPNQQIHKLFKSKTIENSDNFQTDFLIDSKNEKISFEKESDDYKNILNKFSKKVYQFISLIHQFKTNENNSKDINETLNLEFEKEKNALNQLCIKYLSNTNPKVSIKYSPINSKNAISFPNSYSETVIIETEYDKLKSDYDNLNKELFITQRENNELKNEIDKLKKNLNSNDLIKINLDNIEKENELFYNKKNSSSSSNSIKNEEEYIKGYKIIKNENENMKNIITNLSKEIAEIKKKNYEISPSIENEVNKELKEIHSNNITPKKKNIQILFNALNKDTNQNLESKINNLTKKNNEMANQIKEMNIQKKNCLNILKQNENKIKEQQLNIENYLKEIEKLKKNNINKNSNFDKGNNDLKHNDEIEVKMSKLEKYNNQLNMEKQKLTIEINKLENKLNELEKNHNDKLNNNIENLNIKINQFEKKNSSLIIENNNLNNDLKGLKDKINQFEKKNSSLEIENNNLNNDLKELKDEINQFEKKNSSLVSENKNLNNDLKELKIKNNQFEKKNSLLVSENNNLNNDLKELKLKINQFEKKNSSLISENNNLNNDLKELKIKNNQFEKKNSSLISENNNLNNNLKEFKDKTNQLEKKNSSLFSQNNNLNNDLKELKDTFLNVEKNNKNLNKQILELNKIISDYEKENQKSISKNNSLYNDYEQINNEYKSLLKDYENLKKENQNIKNELDLNNKEKEQLNNKLSELIENNKKETNLPQSKNKNKIEEENNELKKEILKLNFDVKKLEKENKNQFNSLNKLKNDYLKETEELTNEIENLNSEIKNLKDNNSKIIKENNEMKKLIQKNKKKKLNLEIEKVLDCEYISINEISSSDNIDDIYTLKKKLKNISLENKLLNEEREKNYKEIEELKSHIEELVQLKYNSRYLKTNSKLSNSSYIIKIDDNNDENDKLNSLYDNEKDLENEKDNDDKTISIKHYNKSISDINEKTYIPMRKKIYIKSNSKFKNKTAIDFDINNIQSEEISNYHFSIKKKNNKNTKISPNTHELIKIFQYNSKIIWYLFKIKNSNSEPDFDDFIWKELKSKKDFSSFKNIPKNESIELQKQIEKLEEKKKELETKLVKKENDYYRLSMNYAKLISRKKSDDKNPDKLRIDIEKLKKENRDLQNIISKYKENENIFGLSFIEDDIEGNQFIDELNFDEIIDNMSKYNIYTYGIGKKEDYNSKERLKKTVKSLISEINFTKKIKIYLGSIFKQLNVSEDDIYDLIGKYKLVEK